MKVFEQLLIELKNLTRSPKVYIPIIAVMFIPLMYSASFLWAFWDPYGHLEELPVAVVNLDRGAEYQGKHLQVGQDFVDNLRDNDSFKWEFVDVKAAEKGLKDRKYYMVIQVPEDFSQKSTTLTETNPQQPNLRYIPNRSYNFIGGQIASTSVEKIKENIGDDLTEAYTEAIFDNIHILSDGLQKASKGADKLKDGTRDAESGAQQIQDNLRKVATGATTLKTGTDNLSDGSARLNEGLGKLKDGTNQLSAGLGKLIIGDHQLVLGVQAAKSGSEKLEAGLNQSINGLKQLQGGTKGLSQGLQQYAQLHPELAADPAYQQLMGTAQVVAAGVEQAETGQEQLASGAANLTKGQKELASGMTVFEQKLGEADKAGQSLQQGAAELFNGSSKLDQGIRQLDQGAGSLSRGSSQLARGAGKLHGGLKDLEGGMDKLALKLNEASTKTAEVKGNPKVYQALSEPVKLEKKELAEIDNYGTGFAPYFISMGLYVGALLFTIVFPLREPAAKPKNAFSMFVGKYFIMAAVGIVQALILDTVVLYGLGLSVESVPLFYLFTIFTSVVFMALIQFLVTSMADPGRFLAVIILIMQLVASGGTFPLELIPAPLQAINPWLPMTYTISALRAIISGVNYGYVWGGFEYLGAVALIMAAGTIIYFSRRLKKQRNTKVLELQTNN